MRLIYCTMHCCTVLYTALYRTLHCTVHCTVLYTALLHCTVQCTVVYSTVQCQYRGADREATLWWSCQLCQASKYCTVQHCAALYGNVQQCTALYYSALHFTVLYCTGLHCTLSVVYGAVGSGHVRARKEPGVGKCRDKGAGNISVEKETFL